MSPEHTRLRDKALLSRLPKVELHRHLEGSFPVDKLYQLSVRNHLDRPQDFEEFRREVQFPRDSDPDFLTFLTKFRNDWYRSHEDVYFIAYHTVRALAEDGLFYIELRFSPEHFALENGFDRGEITRLIVEAGNKAAGEIGLHIRYLLTFNRNKQSSEEMARLYEKLRDLQIPHIVGIDLAGDETNYPPELFKGFFDLVAADGLYRSTIHAGEVSPPSQIWQAIRILHAARIGHGTSAIDDPALQDYLKEHGVALELCITSNYQTGSWVEEKSHPIGALYRKGVPVTLNSDDPFIQNTDLTDDYLKAIAYFDLSLQDLVTLNLNALKASFLGEEERRSLTTDYLAAVAEFRKAHFPGGA